MKWIRLFILSAGAILMVSALNRFLITAGNAQVLALPEPVLGIPLRYAVVMVGSLELLVALICLFGRKTGFQLAWLAWLVTNYLACQIGLFAIHIHPQATGIGSLTDPLHLARGLTGIVVTFILAYLCLGSYTAVAWYWRGNQAAKVPQHLKMSCPACGVHIRFDGRNVGQKIPCPHCQKAITLRKLENLKMSCFFCQEHIEFPAHAIGEKTPCPHCNKDITLKEPA